MKTTIKKFPSTISKGILQIIKKNIKKYQSSEEIFQEIYLFIMPDEENKLAKEIFDFISEKDLQELAEKNASFCYPKTVNHPNGSISVTISLGGLEQSLLQIFNDFILNFVRNNHKSERLDNEFGKEWDKFEKEFFNDDITVIFFTQLANFLYNPGGIFGDIFPQDNIELKYLDFQNDKDKALFHILKNALANHPQSELLTNELGSDRPLILLYEKTINKKDNPLFFLKEATDLFEKACFAIRIVCKGSVHFDFVYPFFFGNYSSTNLTLVNLTNHLFSKNNDISSLRDYVDEIWIQRVWEGLFSRSFTDFSFANQKIRDSLSRFSPTDDQDYDFIFKISRRLEKLTDYIQAIEATIGLTGGCNVEYVPKLLYSANNNLSQSKIEDDLNNLYQLRHKYIHGKFYGSSNSVESIYTYAFKNDINLLDDAIRRLFHYLTQLLIIDALNPNFESEMLKHHIACKRPLPPEVPSVRNCQIALPKFKTIFY